MRIKQNRLKTYHVRKVSMAKDREGSTYPEYASAVSFRGEIWPAGGKIQAEMYGNRLSYIQNMKIRGNYKVKSDEKGILHYVYENGLDIMEGDGMCLYVSPDAKPDYKIISIKPYKPLRLEVKKI